MSTFTHTLTILQCLCSSMYFLRSGRRLRGHAFRTMLVTSSTECAQHCIMDKQCESLNYHHPIVKTHKSSCELNNSTKKKSKETFEEDVTTTYYHFLAQVIYRVESVNFSRGANQWRLIKINVAYLYTSIQNFCGHASYDVRVCRRGWLSAFSAKFVLIESYHLVTLDLVTFTTCHSRSYRPINQLLKTMSSIVIGWSAWRYYSNTSNSKNACSDYNSPITR